MLERERETPYQARKLFSLCNHPWRTRLNKSGGYMNRKRAYRYQITWHSGWQDNNRYYQLWSWSAMLILKPVYMYNPLEYTIVWILKSATSIIIFFLFLPLKYADFSSVDRIIHNKPWSYHDHWLMSFITTKCVSVCYISIFNFFGLLLFVLQLVIIAVQTTVRSCLLFFCY